MKQGGKTLLDRTVDEEQRAARGLAHLVRTKQDQHMARGLFLPDLSALGLVLMDTDYRECLVAGKVVDQVKDGAIDEGIWPPPGMNLHMLEDDQLAIFDMTDWRGRGRTIMTVDQDGNWVERYVGSGRIEVPLWPLTTRPKIALIASMDRIVIVVRRKAPALVGALGIVGEVG